MAQSGRVRIRVIDATGAVIPGAEASRLGSDEKPILSGRANEYGEIMLSDLPIGDLRFIVASPGFKNLPLVISIRNAEEVNLDARLEVGAVVMGIFLRKTRKRWWIFR